jgi:hypothetical protein
MNAIYFTLQIDTCICIGDRFLRNYFASSGQWSSLGPFREAAWRSLRGELDEQCFVY